MEQLRQAQKDGVVLGLKGLSSQPVLRRDIDDLIVNFPDTFNLFLLALSDLQKDEQIINKMGYQQIAGIHGLPTSAWDGVTPTGNAKPNGGYCSHSNPTFPTWHRPYLALMEQTLYDKMEQIAGQYQGEAQKRYRTALQEFRLPFWDYYRPRSRDTTRMPGIFAGNTTTFPYDFSLPQVFCVDTVMVMYPDDNTKLKPLKNPLYSYKFSESGAKDGGQGMTTKDWQAADGTSNKFPRAQTVRYPINEKGTIGSQTRQSWVLNEEREAGVKSIVNMIRDDIYANYATFSNNHLSKGASGSLEDIHNNYHVLIGGNPTAADKDTGVANGKGHMTYVPTAAYDPVFWIHHCLIDRWAAIWQAARPNNWYDGQYKIWPEGRWRREGNQWVENPGVVQEASKLVEKDHLPFRHPNGGFWNGTKARYTKDFGYQYKEAIGSPEEVKKNFFELYRWAIRYDPHEKPSPPPEGLAPLPVLKAPIFDYENAGTEAKRLREALRAPVIVPSAMMAQKPMTAPTVFAQAAESIEVETAPVEPGTAATSIAFTNMVDTPMAAPLPAEFDESQYYRDWYVDHQVKRLALNGAFAIYWFLGDFNTANSDDFIIEPTMAGVNYIFASSREACDNCGQQDDDNVLVSGTKIITPMLMDYVLKDNEPLRDLSPENVVPFLVKNLKWRIVGPDGQVVDPRTVSDFKVGISSKLGARDPNSQEQSIYQEFPQVIEGIIARSS